MVFLKQKNSNLKRGAYYGTALKGGSDLLRLKISANKLKTAITNLGIVG